MTLRTLNLPVIYTVSRATVSRDTGLRKHRVDYLYDHGFDTEHPITEEPSRRRKGVWSLKIKVYLVSYYEEKGFIEASLGGKLTAGELEVFSEELLELVDAFEGRPYQLLLDYSRASGLNASAFYKLGEIRDMCHDRGAQKIVSVTSSDSNLENETSHRLQFVMEGREDYVLDPSYAKFAPLAYQSAVLRAA